MKALSEILGELYEPEPKGEKKFVAKHKAELVEPAKKLDDKIFKPSTKKAPYKEAPKFYESVGPNKNDPHHVAGYKAGLADNGRDSVSDKKVPSDPKHAKRFWDGFRKAKEDTEND